jgi:hypothetical protein
MEILIQGFGTPQFMKQVPILQVALLAATTVLSAERTLPQTGAFGENEPGHITEAVVALGRRVVPPSMPRRSIAPSTNAPPGESIELEDKGTKFTLFIPRGWTATASTETALTVNFHTAVWFVIQEHLRRGTKAPLVCFQLGEGSTVYRQAFEDTNRFTRVLCLVEDELKKRGAPIRITAVDVSSFSAGYGAVRELVKSPEYFKIIRQIVLLDSMYAAYEEKQDGTGQHRPTPEHIDIWVPFARAAMRGKKTFVFTHAAVPTGKYASSSECAMALLEAVGARGEPVDPGSIAAARDPEFPLRYRSDTGNFHVWGYGGEDAAAHLTHVRHMADVWMALEK